MNITIHRGIDQIGGCITEIATDTSKIFIDLGRNLPKTNEDEHDEYANFEAIAKLCDGCAAIFYTHYHGDHIDLFRFVPANIPQYIGKTAKCVMIAKYKHMSFAHDLKESSDEAVAKLEHFRCYEAAHTITIGDIKVTPYFVNHSSADAYMFLIEANGRRILHTGDFREHGYLGKGLEKTINTYIRHIDVLITEGTMLGRREQKVLHENAIQKLYRAYSNKYKNVFILCSSTDIDRLASAYNANKSSRSKPFVCDHYQKCLLQIFSENQGAKTDLYRFDIARTYDYHPDKQKLRNWMQRNGFMMLIRHSHKYKTWCSSLLETIDPEETILIYSMFHGYIDPSHEAYNESLHHFINMFPRFEYCHTSGHATTETLAKVCDLTSPYLAIIPIHKLKTTDYSSLPISDQMKSRIVTQSISIDEVNIIIN